MAAPTPVTSLTFSPNGKLLAFLTSNSSLRVWTGSTLLPPVQLPPSTHISFGETLLAISSSTVPLIRFVSPVPPTLLHINVSVPAGLILALTPPYITDQKAVHGRFALIQEATVYIHSYEGHVVAALPLPGLTIFSATFSPDANSLLIGDTKGNITLWPFLQNDSRPPLKVQAHTSFISALAFAPDNHSTFASAGWDGLARVWKVERGKLRPVATVSAEVQVKRGRKGKTHAVALGPDGLLATGGAAGVVRVWRIAERGGGANEPVAVHDAHSKAVYQLAFAPDGRHVASGSADGTVRVLGVPGRPVLVSRRTADVADAVPDEGIYEIRQIQDVVVKGQRPDRRLIFCPSAVVTLVCPICMNAYDDQARRPICSGACGHTFACAVCNDRLWETDTVPTCPECRVQLVDVVPNYELLRVLTAAKRGKLPGTGVSESTGCGTLQSADQEFGEDYIELKRLSWMELPELAYMCRYNCTVYSGTMDGETVAIRLARPGVDQGVVDASGTRVSETERHIRGLKRLRGPHIAQLYGLSRTSAPDNRMVVVTEIPSGGTLADNLSLLRSHKRALPAETVLALSLQILRATRFLHESQTSAGWAMSADAIALTLPIREDWSMRHRIKLLELGGTIGKTECVADFRREFPADYIGYMAPELLDEDRTTEISRDEVFRRLCMADMYSVGVLLWEIASGNRPFEGKRPAQVVAAVVGREERPGYPPSGVAVELQDLITRLWSKNPEGRPSAKEACELLETVPTAPPIF